VARDFRGVPLVANMLEGGGKTPWVSPERLRKMGYSMVLYPTTVLFQMTYAIQQALANLHKGIRMPEERAVSMTEFEEIVDLPEWAIIENRFKATKGIAVVQQLWQKLAG
jgi:2-methylisocitrate lyase-like PEP mutase family enzyme